MTDNLDSGGFKIISLSRGAPIGVDRHMLPLQIVSVNEPLQDWTFQIVGEHKYKLSIAGYAYTGVLNGKVIASIQPEHEEVWEITHQEGQKAFTIALAKDPSHGWTVPTSVDDNKVEIQQINVGFSKPPHFLPGQLFLIKKDD